MEQVTTRMRTSRLSRISEERYESPRVATSITSCSVHRETGRASQRVPRDMTAIRSQIPNSSGR